MKYVYKSVVLIICIFLFPLPAIHASVSDNTYVVFIWTSVSTFFNPRWIDQFEFDAGDVFRVYTTREAELTGTWIETPLGGTSTWFQAYVERAEENTTTTTPGTTTMPTTQGSFIIPQRDVVKYDINLWGISFELIPPPPLDTVGYSVIFGSGAYLGANAVFLGITSIPGPGEQPSFGGISPQEGKQEQVIQTVTITGINTQFKDKPPVQVAFIPPQGIEITSGITVQSNTKIEFSIKIDVDAPLGFKTVTVTYDSGSKSITKNNAFEIKPK